MRFDESRLEQQGNLALDITERILKGEEIPRDQARTALAMIAKPIQLQQVRNGRDRNAISLIKLGLRDPVQREEFARHVLQGMVPGPASGGVEGQPQGALAAS
jgi:hypothetical protein